MTVVLMRRKEDTETRREGSPVMAEAEMGGRRLRAEECRGLLATPGARRGQEASCPRAFRGSTVLPTPRIQTSGLQKCERINSVILSFPVGGTLSWQP